MSYVLGLKCKECGNRTGVSPVHVCEACFGPYEVEYDYAAMRGKVTRESISGGPRSLWRYWDLLPVESRDVVTIQEGMTPLIHAKNLGTRVLVLTMHAADRRPDPELCFRAELWGHAADLGFHGHHPGLRQHGTGQLYAELSPQLSHPHPHPDRQGLFPELNRRAISNRN